MVRYRPARQSSLHCLWVYKQQCQRPYAMLKAPVPSITEVKQHWAQSVLGWVTAYIAVRKMSRSKQLYLFNQVYPDIPFHRIISQFNKIVWRKLTKIGVICFVPISRCLDGTLRDTEHVPFLCRLASPKRVRNLTMLWFWQVRLTWWFSISFSPVLYRIVRNWSLRLKNAMAWRGDP
jgi:hypothetical protein